MAGRKGSVRWDMDTEILNRLREVANMMIRGAKMLEIAEAFHYSTKTAWRDMQRVRELWRREAQTDIVDKRAKSVAQLEEIKLRAWNEYYKQVQSTREKMAALKIIMDAEAKIADLEGTKAPIVIDQKHDDKQFAAMQTAKDRLIESVERLLNRAAPHDDNSTDNS